MQITRDEAVHAEWFFSGSVIWRARCGEKGEGMEIHIFYLDGSVRFGICFSPTCPPHLQNTQEMHVLSEFSLLKIFLSVIIIILYYTKIELGEEDPNSATVAS